MNYKKTIAEKRPEYIGKTLLLANSERSGLFVLEKKSYILIEINKKGDLSVNILTDNKCNPKDISLREIGITYLNLKDPSVNTMLKYLVTPAMEVERIFNSLRYKYLKALTLSEFETPNKFIQACCNKAFQALTELPVYQGNTKSRKSNDYFWKKAGFKEEAKKQNWEKERGEMGKILSLIKYLGANNINTLYTELIAIKPGFHELYIHPDYFSNILKDDGKPRSKVFQMLRNANTTELALEKFPHEINKNNYFSYASCNVTEGPFVFRKRVGVSYFDEIRKIRSKEKLSKLEENFHILDYYHEKLSSRKKLNDFLKSAKPFCKFMNS